MAGNTKNVSRQADRQNGKPVCGDARDNYRAPTGSHNTSWPCSGQLPSDNGL
ncbi:hypothetical protein PanWU01x14_315810, partial [Parasponia andersonii]